MSKHSIMYIRASKPTKTKGDIKMKKELFGRLGKLNNDGGIDFMEGRDKGLIVLNQTVIINNFAFIKGDDGPYVVFTLKDNDDEFFFGSSVVTKKFQEVEKMFDEEELSVLLGMGIPVRFEERTSKRNRKYINMLFEI